MAIVASINEEGKVQIRVRSSERFSLVEEGLAWDDGDSTVETRLWYLPAIKDLLGDQLTIPKTLKGTIEAATAFLRRPVPAEANVDLNLTLKPFQSIGAQFLLENHGAVLADDCGIGKTPQSLTALGHLFAQNKIERAIVAMTLGVKWQWEEEIKKALGDRVTSIIVDGPPKVRASAYKRWSETPKSILLIQHDAIRNDCERLLHVIGQTTAHHMGGCRFAMVIDEASTSGFGLKNPESKSYAAAMRLAPLFDYRWALTATPIENGVQDLWAITNWIRPGWLGPFDTFQARHLVIKTIVSRRGVFNVIDKICHLNEVKKAFRPLYLRRTAAEVNLQLPRIMPPIVHALDMDDRQAALYAATTKRVREIEARLKMHEHVHGGDLAALKSMIMRLRQICNSPATVGEYGGSPKLDDMESFIEGCPEKVVIATEFAKFAKLIVARLQRFKPALISGDVPGIDRRNAQRHFEVDPRTRVMVITKAGERGLNLQVASVLYNADMPWNPAALRQRIGRICRIGSQHPSVRIVTAVMKETIEERVFKTLNQKQDVFARVMGSESDEMGEAIAMTTSRALDLV